MIGNADGVGDCANTSVTEVASESGLVVSLTKMNVEEDMTIEKSVEKELGVEVLIRHVAKLYVKPS